LSERTAAALFGAVAARLLGSLAIALATMPATTAGGAITVSQPYRLSPHVAPGETTMGIRLLGSVELTRTLVADLPLGGLSALAWDQDESRLYALSDRGNLFHLRPTFDNGALVRVEALTAIALRDRRGRALEGRRADAEGLVVQRANNGKSGDSLLAVSFERHPRIVRFRPDGRYVDQLELPADLHDISRYADPNKALEALTWLPELGFLSAPERPLAGSDDGTISLFALDGRSWRYPLLATPNASLVDMQALPDGSLLTLERSHGLMFLPIVISLRHTRVTADNTGQRLAVSTIAILDSSQGWSVDNFEGLSHHQNLKFFMVSDDNFNALQKTLLVYFELAGTDDPGVQGNPPEFELRQQNPG
jgi:hypothetical protein